MKKSSADNYLKKIYTERYNKTYPRNAKYMTEYRFKNYCREIYEASNKTELEDTMTYIKEEPKDYRRDLLLEMLEIKAKILMEIKK
jgi:hypothetical protein